MVSCQTGRIALACVQVVRITTGHNTLSCSPVSHREEVLELQGGTAEFAGYGSLAPAGSGRGSAVQGLTNAQANRQINMRPREFSPDASNQAKGRACECCNGNDDGGHWQWSETARQNSGRDSYEQPLSCQSKKLVQGPGNCSCLVHLQSGSPPPAWMHLEAAIIRRYPICHPRCLDPVLYCSVQ